MKLIAKDLTAFLALSFVLISAFNDKGCTNAIDIDEFDGDAEEEIEVATTTINPEVYNDEEEEFEATTLSTENETAQQRNYENYQLLRARPENDQHLEALRLIEHGIDDLWTPIPDNVESVNNVDMLVAPKRVEVVEHFLNCSGIPYEISISNIQRAIEEENDMNDQELEFTLRPGTCLSRSGLNWHSYARYDQIQRYLNCLADSHRDKVELQQIGSSSEGRALTVLKIGRPSRQNKPKIWIDGGIHAREWISPASVLYMIYQLVENYDSHPQLIDTFDIYVMPVVNPDGYEYTHTNDRLWRKTRSPSLSGSRGCKGADPNRNWGYRWGGKGASTNQCSETYRGRQPFSEVETRAIRDFLTPRKDNLMMFLTFHSYGQYILYPWGYEDNVLPDNYRDLHTMGRVAADAMANFSGRRYKVGSAAKMLYPAAGGSDDWAKGSLGVEYSYTFELPDTGRYGFLLPASKIQNVADEAFIGVKAMVNKLKTLKNI